MIYAKLKCKKKLLWEKYEYVNTKGIEQGYGIEDFISNWFWTNWR
jgi:hypothetical protein